MPEDAREIRLRCPHCRALCSFRGSFEQGMSVFCGGCQGSITREVKSAFFRSVSAHISARLVEKENRAFLSYLEEGWRRGQEGGDDAGGRNH